MSLRFPMSLSWSLLLFRRASSTRRLEAEHHVDKIGVLASDEVEQRGPAEPSADVEQAHQADETRGGDRGDLSREHLLAHRRGLAEHADPSRGVAEQHDPDQPELWRL